MSLETVEQEAELEEKATEEQTSAQDRFAENLAALRDERTKPTEESVDADDEPEAEAEVEEQVQQPESDAAKVEGPTIAMKAWARQAGLDPELIKLAADDAMLETMVEKYTASREPEKEQEAIKRPEFALTLPEDEFPKDDPVRKQFQELHSHQKTELDAIYGYMNQLAELTLQTNKAVESASTEKAVNEESAFDDFIDTLDSKVLGNRSSNNVSSAGHKQRWAIYGTFKELEEEHPRTPKSKLMEQAAREHGYSTKQAKRQEALEYDNARRLGGGPSKAAAEPALTGRELAEARMKEILSRGKRK